MDITNLKCAHCNDGKLKIYNDTDDITICPYCESKEFKTGDNSYKCIHCNDKKFMIYEDEDDVINCPLSCSPCSQSDGLTCPSGQGSRSDGLTCHLHGQGLSCTAQQIEFIDLFGNDYVFYCKTCKTIFKEGCLHRTSFWRNNDVYYAKLVDKYIIDDEIYHGMPIFQSKDEIIPFIEQSHITWSCTCDKPCSVEQDELSNRSFDEQNEGDCANPYVPKKHIVDGCIWNA